jgi:hypothetical protein
MTDTFTLKGEITNTCTCLMYEENGEEKSIDETYGSTCFGDCWEFAVEDFAMVTETLRNENLTDYWKVENLRLWNGEVSGHFQAKTVADLLRGMTVNSEWTMRYEVFADRIEYSLSHHDSPMGSASVLRPVSEEEYEEKFRW